jgi:hypothetical protein
MSNGLFVNFKHRRKGGPGCYGVLVQLALSPARASQSSASSFPIWLKPPTRCCPEQPGFIENGWVGHKLQLGDETRVNVALLDPRCVMATLAQDDLPQDTDVLRTLVRHNRMQIGDFGQFPCAGVYAVVAAPGTVRTGDHVTVV